MKQLARRHGGQELGRHSDGSATWILQIYSFERTVMPTSE